jgi:predicted phage terminase large subunit-like protein
MATTHKKELLLSAKKVLAEKSLFYFVQEAWPYVVRGHKFKPNWHIQQVCEFLERVTFGDVRRGVINVPPRTGKSTICAVMWPAWTWLHFPSAQWLSISHSLTFATRDARRTRLLMQTDWFKDQWGDRFDFSGDQNQKTRYENTEGGHRIAMGVKAGITGEGGDIILCDDLMDREAANSEVERTNANETYDEAISTRLNDPVTGAILIIMQRMHALDTTGHVLSGVEQWEHLCLPMLYEEDHPHLSPYDARNTNGELLWEDHYPRSAVEAAEARLGPYGFAGQMQQRPSIKGGGIWPRDKFRFHDYPSVDRVTMSCDLSFKAGNDSSYVVLQVWGQRGSAFLLLDQFRARVGFTGTVLAIRQMLNKWPTIQSVLVEDKANGPAVIDSLKSQVPGIIPCQVDGDKESRAQSVAPFIHAGNVYLPDEPWVHKEYLPEIEHFPRGQNDDQVDATAQALKYLGIEAKKLLRF